MRFGAATTVTCTRDARHTTSACGNPKGVLIGVGLRTVESAIERMKRAQMLSNSFSSEVKLVLELLTVLAHLDFQETVECAHCRRISSTRFASFTIRPGQSSLQYFRLRSELEQRLSPGITRLEREASASAH
jgi:hypothetical protein